MRRSDPGLTDLRPLRRLMRGNPSQFCAPGAPMMRTLVRGGEFEMPPGATHWRMFDANGNVVMQGGLNGAP